MEIILNTNKSRKVWTGNGFVELPPLVETLHIYNEWEMRDRHRELASKEVAAHFVQSVNMLIGKVTEVPESVKTAIPEL